ncbi:MAG: hypothetical protein AB8G05_00365 [Oligoflexales bacterium]
MFCNKIFILVLILGINSWSCRKTQTREEIKQENREKLYKLLKGGKQPASFLGKESTPSLSLASGPVVRQYQATGSEEISRILYNTNLMEKIKHSNLETYALNFLDQLEDILHVSSADLSPADVFTTQAKADLLTLNFKRSFQGTRVKNALVTFIFTKVDDREYKLREIKNKSYGRISLENVGTTLPTDTNLELYTGISGLKIESSSLAIHPSQTGEGIKFYLAKQWLAQEPVSGQLISVTIAAGSNDILEAYGNRFSVDHQFLSVTYKENYLEPAKSPSPLAFIPVINPNILTDGNGFADIPAGSDPSQLVLEGERFKMMDGSNLPIDNDGDVTLRGVDIDGTPALTLTGETEGNTTTFTANSIIEEQSLTTLRGVQAMQQLVRKHLTSEQTALLDRSITTFLNAPDSCNAFYSGNRFVDVHAMVFFRVGNGCGSTGLLADVVAHEWCHALDDFTGPMEDNSRITQGSFSEGIGDICSAYLTGNPTLGEGFNLNNPNALRTVENERFFPDDFNEGGSPHSNGQIIGGAFWHLRVGLIAKHGPEKGPHIAESLFFRHLLNTPDFQSSYDEVLTLDDDDGNPATPSPNYCVINKAFARHGLAVEELDCEDDPLMPKSIPANLDLYFGVEADEAGALKWVGSGEEVAQIELCMGGPDICLVPGAQTTVLPHSGKLDGRDYFTSVVPAILMPYSEITLIATHYYGKKTYRNYITSPK